MTIRLTLLAVLGSTFLATTTAHAQIVINPDALTCAIEDPPEVPQAHTFLQEGEVKGNECTGGWHVTGYPMGLPIKQGYFTQLPQGTCYIDVNDNTQCFFRTPQEACTGLQTMNNDIVKNGTMFGALVPSQPAGVDPTQPALGPHSYKCVDANNANNIRGHIEALKMPERSDKVQITIPLLGGGSHTSVKEIAGPYRFIPMPTPYTYKKGPTPTTESVAKAGYAYPCSKDPVTGKTFRDIFIATNKAKWGPKIRSDLAGFRFPRPPNGCINPDPGNPTKYCLEPEFLDDAGDVQGGVQLHHVARRRTQTKCNWGKNSMQNGVLISKELNTHFSNNFPTASEILWVNGAPPY